MLWGAYGANAVHMSVLQEYIAASLELEMGPYYQVSDSFHVYENNVWDKVKDIPIKLSEKFSDLAIRNKFIPITYLHFLK